MPQSEIHKLCEAINRQSHAFCDNQKLLYVHVTVN